MSLRHLHHHKSEIIVRHVEDVAGPDPLVLAIDVFVLLVAASTCGYTLEWIINCTVCSSNATILHSDDFKGLQARSTLYQIVEIYITNIHVRLQTEIVR